MRSGPGLKGIRHSLFSLSKTSGAHAHLRAARRSAFASEVGRISDATASRSLNLPDCISSIVGAGYHCPDSASILPSSLATKMAEGE